MTLVPEVSNPTSVKDFRPIACCSVLYKIIAKILNARMQKVIGEVVNYAQSGFIPHRNISDNIILASELIKGYNQRHISPRCMIKVDLKKAYDSIEWSFLFTVLSELGFPSVFIKWIKSYVTTVSYTIMLNGKPSPSILAKKGLRQGDPISPFLFALGMEYLSRCLGELALTPNFNYHPRCEKLSITHVMFADDLLMVARGDKDSVRLMFDAFYKFSKASGLSANLDKSNIYLGGVLGDQA